MPPTDITELRRLWEAANSTDGCSAMEYETYHRAAHNALPALLDELEAARLEMRRQGSVIAELLEEVRRLTQANGDLRKERDRAVAEAQRQDGVAKGLRKERDALRADNERLRAALEEVRTHYPEDYKVRITEIIDTALAATPAQSLAAHYAALLREVARLVDDCSGEKLRAEADSMEQEAR